MTNIAALYEPNKQCLSWLLSVYGTRKMGMFEVQLFHYSIKLIVQNSILKIQIVFCRLG